MFSRRAKTSKCQQKNSQINPNSLCIFEQLEGRQLYSASPVETAAPTPVGGTLTINASASQIAFLSQSSSGITLNANGKSALLTTPYSNIVVNLGSGNDFFVIEKSVTEKVTVNGGTGTDLISTAASNGIIYAGTGETDVIALGGKNNRLVGGQGYTNIWYTAGNTVVKGTGNLVSHAITSFINTKDMSLDGASFTEPLTNTQVKDTAAWININEYGPLFNTGTKDMYGQVVAGPTILDLHQGEAGTCYFLSSLGSVAMEDPQHIVSLIAPLGDGTYVEQFVGTNGKDYFVRVDPYLPVSAADLKQGILQLEYEHLGLGNSSWAPLEEKGWAYMRSYEQGVTASYGVAEGGFGEQALQALGGTSIQASDGSMSSVFSSGTTMLDWIAQQLKDGHAVDLGFANTVAGELCGSHEYSAVSVVFNSNGTIAGMWVHNPWGVDTEQQTIASAGHNDGYNDGFVFISAATAFSDCNNIASAVV